MQEFSVQPATPGYEPKNFEEALAEAKRTGILRLPSNEICLTINSGIKIEEVEPDE